MTEQIYLALGDSMSIDLYTGVAHGGAVRQFHSTLGKGWALDDRTRDGCRIRGVPRDALGDVITLTIGGNDLVANRERYLVQGIDEFAREHRSLLEAIREINPDSCFIVGNIYPPQFRLSTAEEQALAAVNAMIAENVAAVDAHLADIHTAFKGNEQEYLTLDIEPNLEGATVIAELFRARYRAAARGG